MPGSLFCLLFPFVIAPSFKAMFADFGGHLPSLTRLGLTAWFPMMLGLMPLTELAAGLVLKLKPSARRAVLASAVLASAGSSALCLYSMYAPLFSLSGHVKPG